MSTEINHSDSYVKTINEMRAIYSFWNQVYFDNELVMPVITIQQDARGGALGWFVPREVWKTDEEDFGSTEINMSSQFLNRSKEDIAATMLHEMCHQYAYIKKIKDTSRFGYYHNKKFKEIAEAHGLLVANSGRYHGWTLTTLSEDALSKIEAFDLNEVLYDIRPHRSTFDFVNGELEDDEHKKELKPSSTRKYICGKCRTSVRATKNVRIICADCNEMMFLASRN